MGVRRTVIYGNRCLQLFVLARVQFMSPFLKADGKYYDADDEGDGKKSDTDYKRMNKTHTDREGSDLIFFHAVSISHDFQTKCLNSPSTYHEHLPLGFLLQQ